MKASPENVLERARRFLGWTQDEMAAKLGMSRSTYQRRERLAEEYVAPAEGAYVRMMAATHALEPKTEEV